MRPGRGGAVSAEEDEARRVDRNGEGECVVVRVGGDGQPRVDRDLVGEGRERRQDASPAHHDARRRLADLVQRHAVSDDARIRLLVDRGLDDGVRERDVLVGEVALVADDVVGALGVAAVGAPPHVGTRGEASELDVHVIGRTAHQAHRGLGDARQPSAAALQVVDGAGDHVADADRLPRLGIGHEAFVGIPVLAIEDVRQRLGGAGEGGMCGDVVDHLVAEPHHASRLAKPVQELLACSCAQGIPPRVRPASARRRRRSCLGEPPRVKRTPMPPLYYAVAMTRPEANGDHSRGPKDEGLPYEGLVVVDLSQGVAGPYCGMLFALNGADVIKVEPPAGDWGRSIGRRYGDFSAYGVAFNRGKRSVAIDIKKEEGRELAARLLARADVVIENNRPGVLARLGLGYGQVRATNPDVVYVSVTGFGQEGPNRDLPATDSILQAYSGLMSANRDTAGMPQRIGV